MTRRIKQRMLRESHSSTKATSKPKSIRIPTTSQDDVMWRDYMYDVRRCASGDNINSNESPKLINDYQGVITHPVSKYEKDMNYPHQPLPTKSIPKQLRFTDWKNRK